MKQTAAPWEVIELAGRLTDYTQAKFVVRAPKGAPGGIAVIVSTGDPEEERANAELIAKAGNHPEIFRPAIAAALRAIVLEYSRSCYDTDTWTHLATDDTVRLDEVMSAVLEL